ncbi:thioesterase II family protein [Mycolicibacterium tokaiense]|uniref:Thioesterase TesA n=1 Tax=Mycolicibacterium tokaiense TaxID=39695 RepID=A0A378TL06_9MYCO|nr:thioesterase domain-containing protein [Mycolicibacterium tokaiense]BBY90133.1 thioesterase [Mycolicibacterium tokaiense]STZ61488.1 thioesterase [Mycolicibacterium tokaiense]
MGRLEFQPWIKRFPGGGTVSVVVFPHAGGAAATYRDFATALAHAGADAYIVQYPQRAERLTQPPAPTLEHLAADLFGAADWSALAPLRLFGHCMGALVAFEFARTAHSQGVPVQQLWASASDAPSTAAAAPRVPTTDRELLRDVVALGGTDPRLLADADFIDMLLPSIRADYRAWNTYARDADVRVPADIHAVGGTADTRVAENSLRTWASHTDGAFTFELFDGEHFYLHQHLDALAARVAA